MAYLAKFDEDQGLRAFIQELLDDKCLLDGGDEAARKLLAHGLAAIDPEERAFIEAEIIEPYCVSCEDCGQTPKWQDMLQTYDTGLCKACFKSRRQRSRPLSQSPSRASP
jgi:hypothetical protein